MNPNRTKLDEMIGLPVTRPFKLLVAELAKRDRRRPTEFARIALERAVAQQAVEAGLAEKAKAAGLQVA